MVDKSKKKPEPVEGENFDSRPVAPRQSDRYKAHSNASDCIPNTELKATGKKIYEGLHNDELRTLFTKYIRTIKRKDLDEKQLW